MRKTEPVRIAYDRAAIEAALARDEPEHDRKSLPPTTPTSALPSWGIRAAPRFSKRPGFLDD